MTFYNFLKNIYGEKISEKNWVSESCLNFFEFSSPKNNKLGYDFRFIDTLHFFDPLLKNDFENDENRFHPACELFVEVKSCSKSKIEFFFFFFTFIFFSEWNKKFYISENEKITACKITSSSKETNSRYLVVIVENCSTEPICSYYFDWKDLEITENKKENEPNFFEKENKLKLVLFPIQYKALVNNFDDNQNLLVRLNYVPPTQRDINNKRIADENIQQTIHKKKK